MAPKVRQVKVRVPATSANLGSGFDTVGLALDYHDELTFTINENEPVDNQENRKGQDYQVGQEDQHSQSGQSNKTDQFGQQSQSGQCIQHIPSGFSGTTAKVIIHGEGEDTLPRDETHLVVSAFRRACEAFGLRRFGFTLEAQNNIPQARGMGSSAEAIVAGIAAAAAFAQGDADFNRETIFQMAASMEGHPDNVAPAVYGGLTVSWNFETAEGVGSVGIPGGEPLRAGFHTVNYPVAKAMTAAVFVPDFELSTQKAREALPQKLPYKDAVFNISRVALLPAAMNPVSVMNGSTGQASNVEPSVRDNGDKPGPDAALAAGHLQSPQENDRADNSTFRFQQGQSQGDNPAIASRSNALLFAATQDRLHQPYRKGLMVPSWKLIETLRAKGFAAAVSGAGPCVLVLHYGDASIEIDEIAAAQLESGHWRVLHLPVSAQGVQVEIEL
ncbi:homoserine kinase [Bifidobacterium sp. ESL0728]|uniref:homoserine kinase n=1 Tax=Bifidobacterium sp. ESL0728 TaxID=2983220 RepID=UPI0023F97BE1|nr:homoserine kinase [Bifidobacterium sp. ESL0728]WEV59906.1 homoserine kinase [Bifidobacterium sp. ESL0728]